MCVTYYTAHFFFFQTVYEGMSMVACFLQRIREDASLKKQIDVARKTSTVDNELNRLLDMDSYLCRILLRAPTKHATQLTCSDEVFRRNFGQPNMRFALDAMASSARKMITLLKRLKNLVQRHSH